MSRSLVYLREPSKLLITLGIIQFCCAQVLFLGAMSAATNSSATPSPSATWQSGRILAHHVAETTRRLVSDQP